MHALKWWFTLGVRKLWKLWTSYLYCLRKRSVNYSQDDFLVNIESFEDVDCSQMFCSVVMCQFKQTYKKSSNNKSSTVYVRLLTVSQLILVWIQIWGKSKYNFRKNFIWCLIVLETLKFAKISKFYHAQSLST